jgi:hypothetical protein
MNNTNFLIKQVAGLRHGCLEELEDILVWSAVLVEQLDAFNNVQSNHDDSSDDDLNFDDSNSDSDSDSDSDLNYHHLNDKRSPNFLSEQDKLNVCEQAGLLAKGFYKAETQQRAVHGIPINKQAENKTVSHNRNHCPHDAETRD